LKLVGRGIPERSRAPQALGAALPPGVAIANPMRRAYFGPQHGWLDTRVVNRADLRVPHAGPAIVEEYDATCVIPPGSTAALDAFGNIRIAVGARQS
jgi:N-methylhydantoinase A